MFALLALCAAEVLVAGSGFAQGVASQAVGAYETDICRGPCGEPGSRVVASGIVVLADPNNTPGELPNACYILARSPIAGTNAGVDDSGTTNWTMRRDGLIVIPLSNSPGAGYQASLSLTAGGFRGRVKSLGAAHVRDDWIVGRRTGPSDIGLCADVGRKAAERRARALPAGSLAARAARFLYLLQWKRNLDSLQAFFPQHGDWTYVHTAHRADGDQRGIWRIPAAETPSALGLSGPLRPIFMIQFEAQPIGLLAHQVTLRGGEWRRVAGNRFVPPTASARSPAFIEWRREGDSWVVSAIGDESFPSGDVPSWCC
ncbi:MAG TPA: hypothetical protein VF625_11665 [Longimicrobium sp.]|jgi:hypothetical protein